MSSNIQFFDFNDNSIRVVMVGEDPWFVGADVCKVLELSDVSMSLKRLQDSEKLTQTLFASGQNREMLCISESGLYRLVLTSRKPQAEPFQTWVCTKVLPSIRKTGAFSVKTPALPPADVRISNLKESLKFFGIDAENPRIKQVVQDLVVDKILGATKQLTGDTEEWMGVGEKAERLGYPPYIAGKHRSQLGKWVKRCELRDRRKEKRLCNGTMRDVWLYRDCPELEEAVHEYFKSLE